MSYDDTPLSGEKIKTIDGEGEVVDTIHFKEHPRKDKKSFISKLRMMLGKNYKDDYYAVTVRIESDNGDDYVKRYHCWDVERIYDDENDSMPSWRQP